VVTRPKPEPVIDNVPALTAIKEVVRLLTDCADEGTKLRCLYLLTRAASEYLDVDQDIAPDPAVKELFGAISDLIGG
jgi:hypothetical protein